jgi:outer membrane lipoprotein-sorting protein
MAGWMLKSAHPGMLMLQMLRNLLFAALLAAALASAQSVDEIIAKNIQAHGGLEKIKSVSTLRATGQFQQGSFRAVFVQDNKRANKVREDIVVQGMTLVNAYDGKTGWRISPFEGRKDPDLLSTDDTKQLVEDADIDGQLVDYKNKDHRAELIGHDSVEGTDCYKIKLTLSSRDVRYYYIDTDSFLELKIETERNIRGTVHYDETYFGDYEQVNGLYYPLATESGTKGDPNRVKFTVNKIEINVPMPDSLFTMPTGVAK